MSFGCSVADILGAVSAIAKLTEALRGMVAIQHPISSTLQEFKYSMNVVLDSVNRHHQQQTRLSSILTGRIVGTSFLGFVEASFAIAKATAGTAMGLIALWLLEESDSPLKRVSRN